MLKHTMNKSVSGYVNLELEKFNKNAIFPISFYVIYIYFITIGYFILRAQIFKFFLSCCVPYVNFHSLQEKFVFFKVRPPPLKTKILF